MSPARRATLKLVWVIVLAGLSPTLALADEEPIPAPSWQLRDNAWWTGPLLAANASTLPQGRWLFEPYFFDVRTRARFDGEGERRNVADTHYYGSQSYLLYGLTDDVSIGLIPRFGFNDLGAAGESSGVRVGDLTLQAQYRLTQFEEGRFTPTTSLVVQQTLPIGAYDELGEHVANGVGSGAYSTMLALYAQTFFWMPTGRILRARANVSYTFAGNADLDDVSVYGTAQGFRGRAEPGDSLLINLAGEYSLTQHWVLALDLEYQHDESTRVTGVNRNDPATRIEAESGSSWRIALAPAVEYNFTGRVGLIVGVRWFALGRNTSASITPVAAINIVY